MPLDFSESDPYFKAGVKAFCDQFQITDERLEEMLSACVKDSF